MGTELVLVHGHIGTGPVHSSILAVEWNVSWYPSAGAGRGWEEEGRGRRGGMVMDEEEEMKKRISSQEGGNGFAI